MLAVWGRLSTPASPLPHRRAQVTREDARKWLGRYGTSGAMTSQCTAACPAGHYCPLGTAVAALRNLLGAVLETPDDDARRRTRCANPAFARPAARHVGPDGGSRRPPRQ